MMSVVIATADSERALVATLAPLVSGAVAGLIREVIVADGGSRDGTATVADVAGCHFLEARGTAGARLSAGAAAARAPWLMFLRPGVVLDNGWADEAGRLVRDGRPDAPEAAVFRRARGPYRLAEARSLIAAALGARPRPEQGLLIAKALYDRLGGHRPEAADPEMDLIRRIGRRRLIVLRSAAAMMRD